MTTFALTTDLDASPDVVWAEVNTPRLLAYVSRPLVRFVPIDPPAWPDVWREGDVRVRVWLFGGLPAGTQTIRIRRPDSEGSASDGPASDGAARVLIDDGAGTLVRRWHHTIEVADGPVAGTTRYTDRLEIDAGLLTPAVVAFARALYAHRQRRWHRLVAHRFAYA